MPRLPLRCLGAAILAALPLVASAQAVRFSHLGALQASYGDRVFWGLAEAFSPTTPYDDSLVWFEMYAEGRAEFGDAQGGDGWYGAASVLATGTLRTDVFASRNTGRLMLEEAYVGWRGTTANDLKLDLSLGSRDYRNGEGMLFATGGGNGFERGALTSAPHQAWAIAAVARVSGANGGGEVFYLDPDELKSGNTKTRLFGVRGEWRPVENGRLGTTFSKVIASEAPYPFAPFGIVENGRDGLETWGVDASFAPTAGALAGWSFRGEYATQRSSRLSLDGWGAVAELGYRFGTVRYMPKFSYSPRYFSGDDPRTPGTIERFDPLFYEGSPPAWSSGANGSLNFYNSNLWVQRYRVDLVFSERDFGNLAYYDVRAAERNSPVQYGQGARLEIVDGTIGLVSGFPKTALTHEWYGEYTRVLSPHWFLTSGVAYAKPREGMRAVAPNVETWWGVLVNLSWRY